MHAGLQLITDLFDAGVLRPLPVTAHDVRSAADVSLRLAEGEPGAGRS